MEYDRLVKYGWKISNTIDLIDSSKIGLQGQSIDSTKIDNQSKAIQKILLLI